MARLLVAVSPHGFGHLAQAAAVVNALREAMPSLEVVVRTTAAAAAVEGRFTPPLVHQREADDFGMVQIDALRVDKAASAAAYREFHRDWEGRVATAAAAIAAARPDLILADVPYLTLAAARRAGIPAVAMSCLNWADIFAFYFGGEAWALPIHATMVEAYAGARAFLRTEPAMPMDALPNIVPIGPIMRPLASCRRVLEQRAGLRGDERLVVAAMGGIAMRPPVEAWPVLDGVRWVVQRDWNVKRADAIAFEDLGLSFSEALASCDALLTKPGYGSFSEAAAYGLPVLSVRRPDWPESPYLEDWLRRRVPFVQVTSAEQEAGAFAEDLSWLLSRGRAAPTAPSGIAEAVAYLKPLLGG